MGIITASGGKPKNVIILRAFGMQEYKLVSRYQVFQRTEERLFKQNTLIEIALYIMKNNDYIFFEEFFLLFVAEYLTDDEIHLNTNSTQTPFTPGN